MGAIGIPQINYAGALFQKAEPRWKFMAHCAAESVLYTRPKVITPERRMPTFNAWWTILFSPNYTHETRERELHVDPGQTHYTPTWSAFQPWPIIIIDLRSALCNSSSRDLGFKFVCRRPRSLLLSSNFLFALRAHWFNGECVRVRPAGVLTYLFNYWARAYCSQHIQTPLGVPLFVRMLMMKSQHALCFAFFITLGCYAVISLLKISGDTEFRRTFVYNRRQAYVIKWNL